VKGRLWELFSGALFHSNQKVSLSLYGTVGHIFEDLGILLQWHWKYGISTFTNERQRVQISLLMLFSVFTGSRPATLPADSSSSSNDFPGRLGRRFV
jgi:hypothetical protein